MNRAEQLEERKIVIHDVHDFETDHVFDCGQCFRWNRQNDGSWTGTAGGRTVNVQKSGTELIMDNASPEDYDSFWRYYFDMDRDYGVIKQKLSAGDDVMKKAVEHGSGIRILKQDAWETVISFIISQNSNIPRIKKGVEGICRKYGKKLERYAGSERYDFPEAEVLASLETDDLSDLRLGYRDEYIIETSRAAAGDGCRRIRAAAEMNASDAEAYIRSFKGVGPKVANCIMLFGLSQYESFPLDVWMKKIMSELYGFDKKDLRGMSEFAAERFGKLRGFAQQYLFYYAREVLQ